MVLRIALVTGLVLSLMGVVANGSLLRKLGASAGCSVVRSAGQVQLESCHSGWFKGAPNLTTHGCSLVSTTGKQAYWSCPVS
jgi:hypothetical protein